MFRFVGSFLFVYFFLSLFVCVCVCVCMRFVVVVFCCFLTGVYVNTGLVLDNSIMHYRRFVVTELHWCFMGVTVRGR